MKFRLSNNFSHNLGFIVKRCGYFQIFDRQSGKTSYVHKPTANRYPRFHLYIEENSNEAIFDLHLDQTSTRYDGQTAHNADYESEEVKQELGRIYQTVKGFHGRN